MANPNPYQVLGISPSATPAEIRLAYQRAAAIHHPDRAGGNTEKFKEVTDAFKALKERKCPDCDGSGFIVTRTGIFVSREECPTCWKHKK